MNNTLFESTDVYSDYFKQSDLAYLTYVKIPKELFYLDISSDCKIMYSLLLDRMQLSLINNWIDKNERYYLIFSIKEIMENIKISNKTASNILKTLEKLNFIERKRRGQGEPDLIYLKKVDFKKFEEIRLKNKSR